MHCPDPDRKLLRIEVQAPQTPIEKKPEWFATTAKSRELPGHALALLVRKGPAHGVRQGQVLAFCPEECWPGP